MKVIIPTDFSENAYQAIAYVFDHFELSKIDISLVHTIEQPSSSRGMMVRIDDIMEKDANDAMNKLVTRVNQEFNYEPHTIIRHGHFKDWVEQIASVMKPDIIVMGTKGENNVASKLMGSVTESVIRTSKFPVLAIPSNVGKNEIQNITISAAADEIEKADFIQSWITNLSWKQVRVEILRVLKDENKLVPRSISFGGKEVPVKAVRASSVIDGINDYIENNTVDVLTLVHSHTSWFDYLFGRSVTKSICANVQLPLLVIPARG